MVPKFTDLIVFTILSSHLGGQYTVSNRIDTFVENNYSIISKQLKVKELEFNKNSECIHLWFEYNEHRKLITIEKEDTKWECVIYEFDIIPDSSFKVKALRNIHQRSAKPKSGWNNFLRNIAEYGIYKLRDFKEIENYEFCAGTEGLVVKIAHDNLFKKYLYPCYDVQPTNIQNSTNLNQIIKYIFSEIN